ncbi:hypothetical protein EHEL_061385 [Encephalitozoon hellem ATCC 50504]|uniref:Uncharacterized protein n=1 Tax=Encephalitozoon hellem TaxID=27973 RepID=A0A9Q9F8H3_ENCHE|nr:uncharacterized protein EHEL_061385 [Encephalitozoon hellem ATCC 50504]AHL28945.1 hypothetical protein EHEL_061385 [Encephalitozoon hellem ATCC 50504]UTX43433.1 hypothetical protein GPU96_06g11850 [Encephalitozoon hellem]WEL38898.1 hypothetical protein PFJ87_06g01670 [Encephalitozoon hellem]
MKNSTGSPEVLGILQRNLERKIFALRIDKVRSKGLPVARHLPEKLSGYMATMEISRPRISMKNRNLWVSSTSRMA